MKRKNKTSLLKNILKILPAVSAVIAVVYVGVLVKDIEVPTLMPVSEVYVQGELRFLKADEIRSLVQQNVTGGYFTVDLKHVRELLLDKPWVKDVSLRRKWPAGINVSIEEQVPVAYWNSNAYLSENGDVFEPAEVDKKLNLPLLNGPAGQHNSVWQFMNILYRETAMLDYEVVELNLDERRAWQLKIAAQDSDRSNQIVIKLGRFDTEKRMQRFIQILPALMSQEKTAENEVQLIDMRYPNGFAVRLDATEKNTIKTLSRNLKSCSHRSVTQLCEA